MMKLSEFDKKSVEYKRIKELETAIKCFKNEIEQSKKESQDIDLFLFMERKRLLERTRMSVYRKDCVSIDPDFAIEIVNILEKFYNKLVIDFEKEDENDEEMS